MGHDKFSDGGKALRHPGTVVEEPRKLEEVSEVDRDKFPATFRAPMDNIIFILQHDPERVIDLAPGRTARVINQLNIKKHVLIKSDLRPTHFRRDSNYHR